MISNFFLLYNKSIYSQIEDFIRACDRLPHPGQKGYGKPVLDQYLEVWEPRTAVGTKLPACLLFPLLGLHRVYDLHDRTFFLLPQNLSGCNFFEFNALVHVGLLNLGELLAALYAGVGDL